MNIRRVLLILPVLVIALLAQAYFWVPTYESQLATVPQRANTLIEASIGDAKILNPILFSDTVSGRISDQVFDGLLDLDEDLGFRGRLATDWSLEETAYLLVLPGAALADGSVVGASVNAAELAARITAQAASDGWDDALLDITVEAPRVIERQAPAGDDEESVAVRPLAIRLAAPARLRLALKGVDQDLMQRLLPVLGPNYTERFDALHFLAEPKIGAVRDNEAVVQAVREALPLLEHNPVLTFKLRQGVRFHDGEPFDAQDVRFTYNALMAPKNLSPRTAMFEPVKALEVVDPYTVRVVYKRLFSPAVNAWTIGILPQHLLNDEALAKEAEARGLDGGARTEFGLRDADFSRNPVGTGPFRFARWDGDEVIELSANEDYWEGAPLLDRFALRVIPDLLTQELEFRAGAVDVYSAQAHQAERMRADARYRQISTPLRGYTYIGYHNARPPLDDHRVRRALGMAIDVQSIIRFVLQGQGEPVTGPFAHTTPWYDTRYAGLPYDPEGAREALLSLGWQPDAHGWLVKEGKRFEINLISNNGNPVRKAVLAIAQASWHKIGVKTNTQLFEWAVFLEDFINPSAFDAVVLGWNLGVDYDLFSLWHSGETGFGKFNFVHYHNPEADALLERIRREYDRDRLIELTHALHRTIAADQPYTFLFAPRATRMFDKKWVMRTTAGGEAPVRPSRSGEPWYFMNRWYKSAGDQPRLAADG